MKLNLDCVRDVMLKIEEMPYDEHYQIGNLENSLTQYSKEDIKYTCAKLAEAGYIKVITAGTLSGTIPQVISITDITFIGHQFLASIKPDSVWQKAKPAFAKLGSVTFNIVTNIATSIATQILKSELNLP